MTSKTLTQERLKELLHYNPDTGDFTWICIIGCYPKIGSIAGTKNKSGYINIKVGNGLYRAHRLAFLYMDGEFPSSHVDHINRSPSDNRWCNIRKVTIRQNHENRKDNAKFIGVAWHKNIGRWIARTPRAGGLQKHIGTFKTQFAACYARHAWELK